MERSFSTDDTIELYVECGRGRVDVTATDTTETTVRITGERADDFLVEQEGHRISVVAPRRDGGFFGKEHRNEVVVSMPARSALTAKTGSADVVARGPLGAAWVNTGSGDVTVELVEGTTHVQSGSGDVKLDHLELDAKVKTGSGDVRVQRADSDLVIATGSGDVVVERVSAALAVKTGSGDVQVGESSEDLAFTTGSGDLHVALARRGRITAKGASGDILLGFAQDTPVWTDISTVSGRISSNLSNHGEPAEGQDFVEVRATTASGDIMLQQR